MEKRRFHAELLTQRKAAMGAQGKEEDIILPDGNLTLVDTDVESSTALWEWSPKIMAESLTLHDECLRSCLKKNNGVELLVEGDAFLVFFATAEGAIRFCFDVQEGLMEIEWAAELEHNGIESSSKVAVEGHRIFAGLRVRMGVHTGIATLSGSTSVAKTGQQILETDLLKVTGPYTSPYPARIEALAMRPQFDHAFMQPHSY